jgi:hypothetical protein
MEPSRLLVCLTLVSTALSAAVPTPHADYVGGTAPIAKGMSGALGLDDADVLRFYYEEDTFKLPYSRITSMELGNKPGIKADASAAISWVPKVGKPIGKLFLIAYKDDAGTARVAIFEIYREDFPAIRKVVEARTEKRVYVREWPEDTIDTDLKPADAPVSPLVPVTITSSPKGAMVFFFGQPAGKTPVTTRLMPGSYTVKIFGDGFPAWTRDIDVKPATPLDIDADLSKRQPSDVVIIH